jgi:hypothetical protein
LNHASFSVRHLAQRSALWLGIVVAMCCVAACKGTQKPTNPLIFSPPAATDAWPTNERAPLVFDATYPEPPVAFKKEREAEGAAFLANNLNFSPRVLAAIDGLVVVASDGRGRQHTSKYSLSKLAPGETVAAGFGERAVYRLLMQQVWPDHDYTLVMLLDQAWRLLRYESRNLPATKGGRAVSLVGKRTREDAARPGYLVEGDGGQGVLDAAAPMLAEELLQLIPFMCEHSPRRLLFNTLSVPLREVYAADIVVRPIASGSTKEGSSARPAPSRALIAVRSLSPNVGGYGAVILGTDTPKLERAYMSGQLSCLPGTAADFERAKRVASVTRRDRGGSLLYDGEKINAKYRADGTQLLPENRAESWLSLSTAGLDLRDIALERSQSSLLAFAGGEGKGRLLLEITLEPLMPGMTLESAADMTMASIQNDATNRNRPVQGTARQALTVGGQPAMRVDVLQQAQTKGKDGGPMEPSQLLESVLLSVRGRTVLKVAVLLGPDWRDVEGAVERMFQSLSWQEPSVE